MKTDPMVRKHESVEYRIYKWENFEEIPNRLRRKYDWDLGIRLSEIARRIAEEDYERCFSGIDYSLEIDMVHRHITYSYVVTIKDITEVTVHLRRGLKTAIN